MSSRRLLKSIYKVDDNLKENVDELVNQMYKLLKLMGNVNDNEQLTTQSLLIAIKRLGFNIDLNILEKYLEYYMIINENDFNSKLCDYNLTIKNTINGRNIKNIWYVNDKYKRKINNKIITPILLKDIFLDCKFKIQTNGQIW